MHLKVARAWTLKERFHPFWDYTYRGTAQTCFAAGSGAQPTVAWRRWWQSPLLIRRHLPNVLTDLRHSITNAGVEALNATIQWVKKTARCSATSSISKPQSIPLWNLPQPTRNPEEPKL